MRAQAPGTRRGACAHCQALSCQHWGLYEFAYKSRAFRVISSHQMCLLGFTQNQSPGQDLSCIYFIWEVILRNTVGESEAANEKIKIQQQVTGEKSWWGAILGAGAILVGRDPGGVL